MATNTDTRLFANVVVPVASERDAENTATAIRPYALAHDTDVTLVYVIEKAGGAPDKAGVEHAKWHANRVIEAAVTPLADADVAVREEITFSTDVARGILDVARDRDASAIVYTPRGGNRLVKLLTGRVGDRLLLNADVPVVALPNPTTTRPRSRTHRRRFTDG